jgi:hypothetical protein
MVITVRLVWYAHIWNAVFTYFTYFTYFLWLQNCSPCLEMNLYIWRNILFTYTQKY